LSNWIVYVIKVKNKKTLSILIIIPILALIMWGFFHFKEGSQPLVYENNAEREIKIQKEDVSDDIANSKPAEGISQLKVEKEDLTEIKKDVKDEKSIETDVNEDENEKKSENNIKIKDYLVSWGFIASKERLIDTIILHSSYNILGGDEYDFDKIVQEYRDYGVAPHYVIDREGKILRLVKDSDVAYHAGESKVPDGRTGVNNFSIGIELINSEKDNFTSSQYGAVNSLVKYLKDKYKIKYILGHSDIAPGRKTDPWNINWEKVNK
jgi:hypothetical protein